MTRLNSTSSITTMTTNAHHFVVVSVCV